jgi:3-phosphoglycerate kinase
MKSIHDIPHLKGVKVLVRADFNVPIRNEMVADDFRIRMSFATIEFLQKKGARIIIISHIENPDGSDASLFPVAKRLGQLGKQVTFIKNLRDALPKIEKMQDSELILLENIRHNEGEKKNDPKFAEELASLADIYINEAFPVSHREHASIVGVPKYIPSYAGLQLEKEVGNLSKAFQPLHPFIFILNGAKFETKLPLLEKFMESADLIFVGGALASDFFKAKEYEVGRSLVSKGDFNIKQYIGNLKLLLPLDVMDEEKKVFPPDRLPALSKIVDVGQKTMELLREKISLSKFILWNGPLGLYEDGFDQTTRELAYIIAEATKGGATSIVGGGDTVAAIEELKIGDQFTFMSSGGGAMLDFLAKGTLPGIEALKE